MLTSAACELVLLHCKFTVLCGTGGLWRSISPSHHTNARDGAMNKEIPSEDGSGEAGGASHALMSVFKLQSSSSAWEDPKLPIVGSLSHFCPSAPLPAHSRCGMLSQRALTWSNWAYVWKLGEDLCASWKSHAAAMGLVGTYWRHPCTI